MRTIRPFKRSKICRLAACSALLLLSACNDSEKAADADVLTLSAPDVITNTRAIDPFRIFVNVTINGETTRYDSDEPVLIDTTLARGAVYELSLAWFETVTEASIGEYELPLASASWSQTINGDTRLSITNEDYITTGQGFDLDNDSFSNLEERRAGSNPNDANSVPQEIDVSIPLIGPNNAPRIDGSYDSIWNNARFSDTDGESLKIDNLMIDLGATRENGNTNFRWFALHDNTNLYIYVLGEFGNTSTAYRDSTDVWQDDSVDIYIDGNNSKLSRYDGVDDYHLIIPLLISPTEIGSNNHFYSVGFNSLTPDAFTFHTCYCGNEEHTWEFMLPLASFGIEVGRPFGIDIHMNIDNDGGDRDEKWGWAHPSREDVDVDFTWTTPSYMGTAILEP